MLFGFATLSSTARHEPEAQLELVTHIPFSWMVLLVVPKRLSAYTKDSSSISKLSFNKTIEIEGTFFIAMAPCPVVTFITSLEEDGFESVI